MTTLRFPLSRPDTSPLQPGDQYIAPNGIVYVYDGVKWTGQSSNAGDNNGYVGSTGADGYVGSAGLNGYVGSTGADGYVGSAGLNGYVGSTGADGYVGSAGINGYDGSAGADGTNGYVGSAGADGYVGSAGINGYDGSAGADGYVGSAGADGIDGQSFNFAGQWDFNGPGYNVGDVVRDDGNNLFIAIQFVPQTTVALNDTNYWQPFLQGGTAGAAGADGYVGSTGDLGYTGSAGDLGYVGSTGIDGYVGSTGIDGYVGSAGIDGTNGYDGSAGIDGYVGSTGADGYVGSAGTNGYVGSAGIRAEEDRLVNGIYNLILNSNGVITLPNDMTIDGSGTGGENVQIGGTSTWISVNNDGAPPGFYVTTDAGGAYHQWSFGEDGTLTLPLSSIIQTVGDESSATLQWLPTSGGTSTSTAVIVSSNGVSILTDAPSNENTWLFGTDGSLTFPDATVQSSAYPGVLVPANGDNVSGVANLVFYAGPDWYNTSKVGINPATGFLTLSGTGGAGGIILPNSGVIDVGSQFGPTLGLTRKIYSEYLGGYGVDNPTYSELVTALAGWTPDTTDTVDPVVWTGIPEQTWELTGYFRAPVAGTYTFDAACDDYYFIVLDGDTDPNPGLSVPREITLTQGQTVSYRVLYANVAGFGNLTLSWRNTTSQISDTDNFTGLLCTTLGTTVDITVNNNKTWSFGQDGTLAFPDGTTSTGAVIKAAQGSSYIIQTLGSALASPSNVLSTFEFSVDGTLILPQGSIISDTTNTTVITPPGASAGQSLVIRPTAVSNLTASGYIVPGVNLIITLTNGTGVYSGDPITYTITGATAQQLGIVSLTGTFPAFDPIDSVPQTTTLVLPIPEYTNATTFTLTVGGSNPFASNSITVTDNGVIETSHVHLVAGNPATTDIYLGDDDQYVKIEKNGGNVVVGVPNIDTSATTQLWTFGADGILTIPSTVGDIYRDGVSVLGGNGNGIFTTTTAQVVNVTNITASTSTVTGALVVEGGIGVGGDIHVGGDLYTTNLQIADTIFDTTSVSTDTTATVVIDSYSISNFRSSKYLIQIDEGLGETADFQVVELILLVNNMGIVYSTQYGLVTSGDELGEFSADMQNDNIIRLYFTPFAATTKTIKVLRTAMTI